MGRAALRRLDWAQNTAPRAESARPRPPSLPPRIAQWQLSEATTRTWHDNAGWSPRWTSLPPATASCSAGSKRRAPLHVLTTWQSRFSDVHDGHAVADGNRLANAQLDRRLAQWTKRYPELDVRDVAVHGSTLNYIAKNADSIQLLVVGQERGHGITELVGPPGNAALHDTDCSVLVCEPQNVV